MIRPRGIRLPPGTDLVDAHVARLSGRAAMSSVAREAWFEAYGAWSDLFPFPPPGTSQDAWDTAKSEAQQISSGVFQASIDFWQQKADAIRVEPIVVPSPPEAATWAKRGFLQRLGWQSATRVQADGLVLLQGAFDAAITFLFPEDRIQSLHNDLIEISIPRFSQQMLTITEPWDSWGPWYLIGV